MQYDCDTYVGEGVAAEPDWDMAAQPAPDYEVDQRISWWMVDVALFHGEPATRAGNRGINRSSKPVAKVYTETTAVEWLILYPLKRFLQRLAVSSRYSWPRGAVVAVGHRKQDIYSCLIGPGA